MANRRLAFGRPSVCFSVLLALWAGGAAARFAAAAPTVSAEKQALARQILAETGIQGGLVVHLGCGDGLLTAALGARDAYLVHGLDADAGRVRTARENVRTLGLYGPVSIDQCAGDRLPYIDNLVNLVVAEQPGGVSLEEMLRVLAPEGIAFVKSGEKWTKTVKPRPPQIAEWNQYLHDRATTRWPMMNLSVRLAVCNGWPPPTGRGTTTTWPA